MRTLVALIACTATSFFALSQTGDSYGERLRRLDSIAMPHPEGYTAFFPVQRFICRVDVPVDGPEVLSHVKSWNRQGIGTYSSGALYVSQGLHGRRRYRGVMDEVAENVVRESRRLGLDSVEVLASFVQGMKYIKGENFENYPEETLARYWGDCSDTSILMQLLLKSMGCRGDLALLMPYKPHAMVGLPVSRRRGKISYAYIECTNFSPVGLQGQADVGPKPRHVTYQTRGTMFYQGLDRLMRQHDAVSRNLNEKYMYMPLHYRLKAEENWVKHVRRDDREVGEAHDKVSKAWGNYNWARHELMSTRDSIAMLASQLRTFHCLANSQGEFCQGWWDRAEAMAQAIPAMEETLQLAVDSLEIHRTAWNGVVDVDPWFGEFDLATYVVPPDRGHMPALGPCCELAGAERQACTEGEIIKYISRFTEYPEELREERVSGTVFVQFEVGMFGVVQNVNVVRGVDPRLDEMALRAVRSLPVFEPARLDGERVSITYTMPVKFVLREAVGPSE